MGEYSPDHFSPRSQLPSYLDQQRPTTSSHGMQTPFQPFDPFNAAVTLDTNDTTDLDELSNLLSRQFLEDVDAETTLPTTSSPQQAAARLSPKSNNSTSSRSSSTYCAPHSPNSNIPLANPWRVDEGSGKKPWSPALETTSLLSPPLFPAPPRQQDDTRSDKTQGWDRLEPYRNDFEFDPTLQLHLDTPPLVTPSTTKANMAPSSCLADPTTQPMEANQPQQQQAPINMTLNAALKKISFLFIDRDETELRQTLASFDYDVERTIEALLSSMDTLGPSPSTPVAHSSPSSPPPPTVKTAIPTATPPSTTPATVASPKKRQVCRHYLAGECYRKDCWFAHDLEVKPCKFW